MVITDRILEINLCFCIKEWPCVWNRVRSFPGLVKELVLTGDEGLDSVRRCSEMSIQPGEGSSFANKFKTRAMSTETWGTVMGGGLEA